MTDDITNHKDWQKWKRRFRKMSPTTSEWQLSNAAVDIFPRIYEAGQADAQANLTAARARIAELETAQRWQPIESAPKDGTDILAIWHQASFGLVRQSVVKFYPVFSRWKVSDSAFLHVVDPTHWMPLPAPPTEKE